MKVPFGKLLPLPLPVLRTLRVKSLRPDFIYRRVFGMDHIVTASYIYL